MTKHVCKNCGKAIPEGTKLGSGKHSDGVFCSLACYAVYRKPELLERARKTQTLADRHRNS